MGDSDKFLRQIATRLGEKPTEELVEIYKGNDRGLWSDQAFTAIEEILLGRGVQLPDQGEKKQSEPKTQTFLGSNEIPYLHWAFYLLFLFWIAVLHPLFLIGKNFTLWIHNPLYPDLMLRWQQAYSLQDRSFYFGLWNGLSLLEIGILCFGIYVGYLLVEKKSIALFWTKNYLFSLLGWIVLSFFLFNFYPIIEEILFITGSVIDTSGNWGSFHFGRISKKILENIESSLEQFMIPFVCIIIWYIFFSKSQWIAKRYDRN